MAQDWRKVIDDFIRRHDLHATVPVQIERAVEAEGITLRFVSGLEPVYAYAIAVGPVRRITVDADLPSPIRRMAIAHELAHLLLDDIPAIHFWTASHDAFRRWIEARSERRANHAALRLLVPNWVIVEAGTISSLAALCVVPPDAMQVAGSI